jgi:hypothetical protein
MPVKCTYDGCGQHFATEKDMRRHKTYDDDHDYCSKCDEDFQSVDEFVMHKISRPDMHNKACRVCGEEFKSSAGLRGHIEYASSLLWFQSVVTGTLTSDSITRWTRSSNASAATRRSIGLVCLLNTSSLGTAKSSLRLSSRAISCISTWSLNSSRTLQHTPVSNRKHPSMKQLTATMKRAASHWTSLSMV